jgi:predicted peptidase
MAAALPEEIAAFTARCFVEEAGQKLPYRLLLPEPRVPGGRYPLLLLLHGAGERGTDNVEQLGNGLAALLLASRRGFPCVAVVPQCPPAQRWVEVDWSAASHPLPSEPAPPLHAALALVESLVAEYACDPARLYLLGLSMGGYGVWDAASRQPERFAAAAPICGGAADDAAPGLAAAGLPVWAFHGAKDPVVPVERSRRIVAALRGCGGPVRYTEYAEVGHDAWTWALKEPELLPWLFAQRNKNYHPRTIPPTRTGR